MGEARMSKVYKTVHHPVGYYTLPWFEIKGDKLFATDYHPSGRKHLPWFQIKGSETHATLFHPRREASPHFVIREK